MWCVFTSANGASFRFVAFTDEIDKLLTNTDFYAAFRKFEDARRFVDLINSTHY